jgi:DNA-binding NtrC family response regulator
MAQLVLLLGDDRYVSFAVVDRAVIGRSSECDIQVVDSSVSRKHAQLTWRDDRWYVEDLGSASGIWVDGHRASGPTALRTGGTLEVGTLMFVLDPPFAVAGDLDGERSVVFVDGDESFDSAQAARLAPAPALPTEVSLESHRFALEVVAGADRAALPALVERLAGKIGAERVILLERFAGDRLRPVVIHGKDRGVAVSRTVIARALASRVAFAIDDAIAEVAFARATSVFELGVRAMIVAPLVQADRVLGVLIADHRRRGAFTAGALGELSAAAVAAAVVLARGATGPAPPTASAWIGRDPATLEVLAIADRAAASTSRVLITGESGTGKELIARRIHAGSARAAGPLIALNCAALGEGVLDSELFGHEKGAFTGAQRRKRGCFEQADGGSLFLDEVGELTASTQAKLLRAIQEGRFFRVGGEQPIDVDVRVVAATNRDLRQLVRDGRFREDLYFRLAVIPIELPPLRKRGTDLVELTEHFLAAIAGDLGRPPPRLTEAAWQRWRAYPWPGNVRELRNAVERLVVLCSGTEVEIDQLPAELQDAAGRGRPTGSLASALGTLERELIADALARHAGNKSQTARALGISRPTLDKKIRDHGLGEGGPS